MAIQNRIILTTRTMSESIGNEHCPCGKGGPLCNVDLVQNPLSFSCDETRGRCLLFLERTEKDIDMANFLSYSQCECLCSSWGGADCSEFVVLSWNSGLTITLAFVLFFFFSLWYYFRNLKNLSKDWISVPITASYYVNTKLPCNSVIFGFVYRLVVSIFIFSVQIYQFVRDGGRVLQFYTVWNFIAVISYFIVGTFVSYFGIQRQKKIKHVHDSDTNCNNNNIPTPSLDNLGKLHFALLQIELPGSIMLDLILWGLLYQIEGPNFVHFTSFIQHAANVGFLLIDFIFFTRYSFNAWHVLLLLSWASIYGTFQAIYITAGNCPAYFFMNMSVPSTIPWMLGVVVLHAVFFFIIAGISWHCSCCLGRRHHVCDNVDDEEINRNPMLNCLYCRKSVCIKCGPPSQRNIAAGDNDQSKKGRVDPALSIQVSSEEAFPGGSPSVGRIQSSISTRDDTTVDDSEFGKSSQSKIQPTST